VLSPESGELDGVQREMRAIAAHQFEQSREHLPVCVRADMCDARDPRLGGPDVGNRTRNVAQLPQWEREMKHRPHAGVISEAKGEIIVTPGLEQRERAFQMVARLDVFTGQKVARPASSMRNPGFGRIGPCLNVAQESRRARPHRWQLAPHIAAGPQPVIGRQPLLRVPLAICRRTGSRESFRRFGRARPSRREKRVAIGDPQLRRSPPRRRLGLEFLGFFERREQRLRLGDLGHFGRRRKAFERRRENVVGLNPRRAQRARA
jgi:hypothetical protein